MMRQEDIVPGIGCRDSTGMRTGKFLVLFPEGIRKQSVSNLINRSKDDSVMV